MRFTVDRSRRVPPAAHFPVDPVSDQTADHQLNLGFSQRANPGLLYVALPGERVDGHDFAAAAVRGGRARACSSQHESLDQASADRIASRGARHYPGARHRRRPSRRPAPAHGATVLRGPRHRALPGSTGKTTTKNLVRDVLAAAGSVCGNEGQPEQRARRSATPCWPPRPTRATSSSRWACAAFGQLEELCGFVRPQWGLVTNVGESHIELLGSRENIARAKVRAPRGACPQAVWRFVNAARRHSTP